MNPASAMNTLSSEDFNTKKPEEVIKPEFLDTYKTLHSDIWHRLIQVHTNIIILEKIEKFPFEHIYAPQENIFWTMVYWNFLYVAIVFLHSLTTDQGDTKHTLTRFANIILNDGINDTDKPVYQKLLKNAKLDNKTEQIRKKIAAMRHNVISHRFLDSDSSCVKHVQGVSLAEVRRAYDDVAKLFRAVNFGVEHISTLYVGGTVGGKPVEKDIDKLLDLIVKDSYWLTEPERKQDFWPPIRETMSEEDIAELNEFRNKFGMPPA